jgi:hypothetical protein
MYPLFLYNFCLLLIAVLCYTNDTENTFTALFLIGLAVFLPVIASLKEIFYLESDYWEYGMLTQILRGFRKEANTLSRWMVFSFVFWVIFGAILLINGN